MRRLAVAGALALLTGCYSFLPPRVEVADTAPAWPAPPAPPPPVPTGSIYQSANYRPYFEDHRARVVGDALQVEIVEKVSAVQKSTSSVEKAGSVESAVSAIPLLNPNALKRAGAAGNSNNTFKGKGATESSNDFSGTITVVVTGVLTNGHLVVAGEKQIGVNSNVDVLRFSGQVDPRSIRPGNSVPSTAIANVRVEQRGRGAAAEANQMGWLARFFLSVLPI
jgi:flagellar L-ring protein precursor FlgH